MKDYIAIAIVNFFNDMTEATEKDIIVLTEVENYQDAITRIEAYYASDIDDIQLTLLEGPFLQINKEILDKIMKGDITDA